MELGSLLNVTITVMDDGFVTVADAEDIVLAPVMVAQMEAVPPALIEVGVVVAAVMVGGLPPGKAGAPGSVITPLATPSLSRPGAPSVRTKEMELEVLAVGVTVMQAPLAWHLTQTALETLANEGSALVGSVTVTVTLPPTGTGLMVKVKKPRGKERPDLEEKTGAPAGVVVWAGAPENPPVDVEKVIVPEPAELEAVMGTLIG